MVTSSNQQGKQLRNDLLTIASLIARLSPDAPFVESGFLRDLCVYASFPEGVRQPTISQKDLRLTCEYEDFELKKALLCILTTLSVDKAAIKVGKNCPVVKGDQQAKLDGCQSKSH